MFRNGFGLPYYIDPDVPYEPSNPEGGSLNPYGGGTIHETGEHDDALRQGRENVEATGVPSISRSGYAAQYAASVAEDYNKLFSEGGLYKQWWQNPIIWLGGAGLFFVTMLVVSRKKKPKEAT